MTTLRHIILSVAALMSFFCARANAQTVVSDSLLFRFYFRQGHPQLDLNFGDNRKRFDALKDSLLKISRHPGYEILSINIEGSASPEGTDAINASLSLNRARNLRSELLNFMGGGV